MQHTTATHLLSPLWRGWLGGLGVLLLAGAVWAGEVDIPAPSRFQVVKANAGHVQLLRRGGLVVYMRHGATDARIPDQIPVNLNDCHSQRPLTDAGRAQLDQIKGWLAKLKLPYTQIISSPFCRAVESAQRVFGGPVQVDADLRYTASMPEAEKKPAVLRTRYWLSRPVDVSGLNRIVVAHGPNIAEIMDYLPPEATLVIFRPLGESANPGFEYVASIAVGDWPALLAQLDAP